MLSYQNPALGSLLDEAKDTITAHCVPWIPGKQPLMAKKN